MSKLFGLSTLVDGIVALHISTALFHGGVHLILLLIGICLSIAVHSADGSSMSIVTSSPRIGLHLNDMRLGLCGDGSTHTL